MAHFAEIKQSDNKVLRVVVLDNADIDANGGDYSESAEQYVANKIPNDPGYDGEYPATYWKQTSYNNNARYNYATVDGTWDNANQAFIDPQPFDSWTLSANFLWEPPVVYPTSAEIDGVDIQLIWNEADQKWQCYKDQDPFPMYDWNAVDLEWTATGENYSV